MTTENLSKLTGEELLDGKEAFSFSKMCLNCAFVKDNEKGELVCGNDENMQAAMAPVYEALQKVNGYNVNRLEVEPVALKQPTKKCGKWTLRSEILDYVKTLLV